MNSNIRMAATLCSLRIWFVSGICVDTLHKEVLTTATTTGTTTTTTTTMTIIIIIIIIIIISIVFTMIFIQTKFLGCILLQLFCGYNVWSM